MKPLIACLILMVACGSEAKKANKATEGGGSGSSEDDIKVLQLKHELPKCQKDLRGALRFIAEEQKFYKCADGDEWEEIDLRGPAGAAAQPCGVSATGLIACADGSTFQIPQTKNGIDGKGCTVSSSGLITCGSTTYQVPTPAKGNNGNDGQSVGVRILSINPGATCTAGGYSLQSFIDADKDGAYDAGETLIGSASNLCRGDNGSGGFNSLVSTTSEEPGSNCANGGAKIQTGLDNGDGSGVASNGVLEAGEIDATSFVCTAQIDPNRPPTAISAIAPATLSLTAAIAYCNNLTESLSSDWKLPSYEELILFAPSLITDQQIWTSSLAQITSGAPQPLRISVASTTGNVNVWNSWPSNSTLNTYCVRY